MITVIHGDDVVASRKKIDEITSSSLWLSKIDLSQDNISYAISVLDTSELFSDTKSIVLENVSKIKKGELNTFLAFIQKHEKSKNVHIIVWESKKIDVAFLQQLRASQVLHFDVPKYFYQFLDSLHPNNGIISEKLFLAMKNSVSDEQLFYSIVKRIRQLMLIKTGRYKEFEDTKKLADWQIKKLKSQESYWSEQQLVTLYHMLFQLELDLKTSGLPLSLGKHIDILLLSL